MISQSRAIEASRDTIAALGPNKVAISVEEDDRRRWDSLSVSDLTSRIDLLRLDVVRIRAEADDRSIGFTLAEAHERKPQDALQRASQGAST